MTDYSYIPDKMIFSNTKNKIKFYGSEPSSSEIVCLKTLEGFFPVYNGYGIILPTSYRRVLNLRHALNDVLQKRKSTSYKNRKLPYIEGIKYTYFEGDESFVDSCSEALNMINAQYKTSVEMIDKRQAELFERSQPVATVKSPLLHNAIV